MTEFYFAEGNPSMSLFSFVELSQRYHGSVSAELVADGLVRLIADYELKDLDDPFVAHFLKRDQPDQHWALRPGDRFALYYDLALGSAYALSTEHRSIFSHMQEVNHG